MLYGDCLLLDPIRSTLLCRTCSRHKQTHTHAHSSQQCCLNNFKQQYLRVQTPRERYRTISLIEIKKNWHSRMRILHLNVACNLVCFGQISTNIINLWCTHSLSVHIYQSLHYDYDTCSDLCECVCFLYVQQNHAYRSSETVWRNKTNWENGCKQLEPNQLKCCTHIFNWPTWILFFQHWHRNSRHFFHFVSFLHINIYIIFFFFFVSFLLFDYYCYFAALFFHFFFHLQYWTAHSVHIELTGGSILIFTLN